MNLSNNEEKENFKFSKMGRLMSIKLHIEDWNYSWWIVHFRTHRNRLVISASKTSKMSCFQQVFSSNKISFLE